MADHKNGMLDDIGEEPAPAIEAQQPESEPEPHSEPEAEAGAEGGEKPRRPDPRPEGYVTKEERDRVARERDEYRQRAAVLEERTQKIIDRFFNEKAQPEQKAPEDPEPEYERDPIGWIGWRKREDQRDEEARQAKQKEWQQQEQARQEFQDTLNRATARFQKVVAARPEVGETYNAVREHVAGLYRANGVPDHQIKAMVDNYEASVIRWARQEYIPIEDAIEQAAATFGIATPQRQQQAKPTPERDPQTGQFLPSEAEKAAKVRESQERNASLSSAPGAPVKKMSAKELASMSEEDMWRMFENVGKKPGGKQFDRDMGFR